MKAGSVERRFFGLNNLPRFSPYSGQVHTVRGFEVDRSILTRSSQFFAFREGLALPEVARRISYGGIFIPLQELINIGINDRGVNRDILRAAIDNSQYKDTIDKLELRENEERTTDNLICAVLGKVGRESKVLKPFNARYALGLYKDKPQEFSALFGAFTKFIGVESIKDILISRAEYVLPLAGQQMSSRSNPMKELLITARAESLPGDPFHNQLRALAAERLDTKPVSELENYYMAIWVNSFYKNDAEAQGSFMAQALGFSKPKLPEEINNTALISDPRSHFIAEASEFLFGNDAAKRDLFIAGGQQAIVNDFLKQKRTVISDFRIPRGNYLMDDPYKQLDIPIT